MKMLAKLFYAGFYILFLKAAYVNCYKLFVFGDSFADTGNLPKLPRNTTRDWYPPYGFTWPLLPSGRFSNGMLQTDFMAKIIGIKTPPTYANRAQHGSIPFGMNFAAGGAGIFDVPRNIPKLGVQIDYFEQMIKDGTITKQDLERSVAMVAISGNDFAALANETDISKIQEFIGKLTSQLGKDIERLPELGISKVLINNLHPLGCTPWQARPSNYTSCAFLPNLASVSYNTALVLPNNQSFFILDLYGVFKSIVDPEDQKPPVEFKYKMASCCESFDPDADCGAQDANGVDQYKLCEDPWNYFYWDSVHPSQDGWQAVMKLLEGPIKKFLGI